MPTPFRERAVLNVLDLSKQPQTEAVLVCSGDDHAIAAFLVGVDRVMTYPDVADGMTEGYRTGEPLPVIRLSKDVPFVVFSRSILEVLTFVDRAKLGMDDENEKHELLRELDPESAAVLDSQRAAVKAARKNLEAATEPLLTHGSGQYL